MYTPIIKYWKIYKSYRDFNFEKNKRSKHYLIKIEVCTYVINLSM